MNLDGLHRIYYLQDTDKFKPMEEKIILCILFDGSDRDLFPFSFTKFLLHPFFESSKKVALILDIDTAWQKIHEMELNFIFTSYT